MWVLIIKAPEEESASASTSLRASPKRLEDAQMSAEIMTHLLFFRAPLAARDAKNRTDI